MGRVLPTMPIEVEAEPGLERRRPDPQFGAFCSASLPTTLGSGPAGVTEREDRTQALWSLPHARPHPSSGSLSGVSSSPTSVPSDPRAAGPGWGPLRGVGL